MTYTSVTAGALSFGHISKQSICFCFGFALHSFRWHPSHHEFRACGFRTCLLSHLMLDLFALRRLCHIIGGRFCCCFFLRANLVACNCHRLLATSLARCFASLFALPFFLAFFSHAHTCAILNESFICSPLALAHVSFALPSIVQHLWCAPVFFCLPLIFCLRAFKGI